MAAPLKRSNTWHRPAYNSQSLAEGQSVQGSVASRSSKLSWHRGEIKPSEDHLRALPDLSFSQQVEWIQKHSNTASTSTASAATLPRPSCSKAIPQPRSRLSVLGRPTGSLAPVPYLSRPACQSNQNSNRHWVRPTYAKAEVQPCADLNTRAAPVALSRLAAGSEVNTRLQGFQHPDAPSRVWKLKGAAPPLATSAFRASSDSSNASSSCTLRNDKGATADNQIGQASVPGSSALQPRTNLQYANSHNGLTLRRVSISKKAQRQQQHLVQHASCRHSKAGSDFSASDRALHTSSSTPQQNQQDKTSHIGYSSQTALEGAAEPLASSGDASMVTPAAQQCAAASGAFSKTPAHCPNQAALKRKLSLSSVGAKRMKSSASKLQSPSRSKKLQRLGDDLYSSSGRGKLLRKGSQAVSKLKRQSHLASAAKTLRQQPSVKVVACSYNPASWLPCPLIWVWMWWEELPQLDWFRPQAAQPEAFGRLQMLMLPVVFGFIGMLLVLPVGLHQQHLQSRLIVVYKHSESCSRVCNGDVFPHLSAIRMRVSALSIAQAHPAMSLQRNQSLTVPRLRSTVCWSTNFPCDTSKDTKQSFHHPLKCCPIHHPLAIHLECTPGPPRVHLARPSASAHFSGRIRILTSSMFMLWATSPFSHGILQNFGGTAAVLALCGHCPTGTVIYTLRTPAGSENA